jgi:hypothetical protein
MRIVDSGWSQFISQLSLYRSPTCTSVNFTAVAVPFAHMYLCSFHSCRCTVRPHVPLFMDSAHRQDLGNPRTPSTQTFHLRSMIWISWKRELLCVFRTCCVVWSWGRLCNDVSQSHQLWWCSAVSSHLWSDNDPSDRSRRPYESTNCLGTSSVPRLL